MQASTGDEFFWSDKAHFIRHEADPRNGRRIWNASSRKRASPISCFTAMSPHPRRRRKAAQDHGLVLHVFEEGYLRPFWITYERDGSNGHSALMQFRCPRCAMRCAPPGEMHRPAHWGDMRQHKFYGALYHFFRPAGEWPLSRLPPIAASACCRSSG